MNGGSGTTAPPVEWGWAGRALEEPSGDLHVVAPFPGGVLVALIDGLGHGLEAAAASRAAEDVLTRHAGESVVPLVQRCHEALRKTRGAVMTLASFDARASTVTWTGVGNVDAMLLRRAATSESRHEALSLRGGVVGYQLPPLRADVLVVAPGDTLIMVTDGIASGFSAGPLESPPQEIAESIVARFTKGTDDAHVVVARYLGAAP